MRPPLATWPPTQPPDNSRESVFASEEQVDAAAALVRDMHLSHEFAWQLQEVPNPALDVFYTELEVGGRVGGAYGRGGFRRGVREGDR